MNGRAAALAMVVLATVAAPGAPARAQGSPAPGEEPAAPAPEFDAWPLPEDAPEAAPERPPEPPLELEAPSDVEPAYELVEPDVVEEREVVGARPGTLLGRQAGAWLELGVTADRSPAGRVVALGGELGLRYRVAENVVADASFGLTYAATHVHGEVTLGGTPTPYAGSFDRVEPGNPVLGGAFVHRDAGYLLEVGLAIGIPTAARDDPGADAEAAARRAASELAARTALAMRGYRGAIGWAPERFSLAVPFRVAVPVAPLVLEIDGALSAMFPVIGDRNTDVDTLIELGAGAGARIVGPLALGARIAGVGAASGKTAPEFTLSVEPWARLRFDPVQVTARGVLNVAGDDALGGARGPSFGVFVGAGVEI